MSIGKLWYERDCCYTCAHWDITAARETRDFIERMVSMGLPGALYCHMDGECTEVLEGLTLVIDADATVRVCTDVDFCCIHYCDIDEDEP